MLSSGASFSSGGDSSLLGARQQETQLPIRAICVFHQIYRITVPDIVPVAPIWQLGVRGLKSFSSLAFWRLSHQSIVSTSACANPLRV